MAKFLLTHILLILAIGVKAQISTENIKAWYIADSIYIDGDNCVWPDVSRNNNHVYQTNKENHPKLITDATNSQSVLRFDGNDYLDGGDICDITNNGISIFIVGKTTKSLGCYLAKSAYAGVPKRYGVFYENKLFTLYNNSTLSKSRTLNNYELITSIYNPKTEQIFLYADGQLLGSQSISNTDMNSTYNFLIGAYNNASGKTPPVNVLYLNGDIAEIIIFDAALPDSCRTLIERYLNVKYFAERNIPEANLGDNITFKQGHSNCKLTLSHSYAKYLWSTGDTTATITVAKSGKYSVIVTDDYGYTSYDTIIVFPKLQYPCSRPDTTICHGDSIIWQTNLIGNYTYLWNDGTSQPNITIKENGKYSVIVTDNEGNLLKSDTITVNVDNFGKTMSIGSDTTFTCLGSRIYLQNGFDNAVNYLWSDGTTQNYYKATTSEWVKLHATNVYGCSATDSSFINIKGVAPTVDISYTPLCQNREIEFNNLSPNNLTSVVWDFGDGSISTHNTPKHTYTNYGRHLLQMTITDNFGCSNYIKQHITINQPPIANFTLDNTCSFSDIQFIDKSEVNNAILEHWEWSIDGKTYSAQNPTARYTSNGTQKVTLIVGTNQQCFDTITHNIEILQGPNPNFTYSLPCSNTDVYFTNKTQSLLGLTTNYKWIVNNQTISEVKSPTIVFSESGLQTVTLVASQLANGCSSSISKIIDIKPKPEIKIIANTTCQKQETQLLAVNANPNHTISQWQWHMDSLPDIFEQNPIVAIPQSGNYTLTVTANDTNGCSATTDTTIFVKPSPKASFWVDTDRGPTPLNVNCTNTSVNANSYQWLIDNYALSSEENFSHCFTDSGSFAMQLVAHNRYGCSDTTQHIINATPKYYDLFVIDAKTVEHNGYITIQAIIGNKSLYNITNATISLTDNLGHNIRETINETLVMGKAIYYTFAANIAANDNLEFICIEINPGSFIDSYPNDNKLYINIKELQFKIYNFAPNPVNTLSKLTFAVPSQENVSINLYNESGILVTNLYNGIARKGINSLNLSFIDIPSGYYICQVAYKNQTRSIKLWVKQ